ncbi:MAG: PadR family transcriptional regulator [Steroidobacteraceae bacterium]
MSKRKVSNPLALAALACLYERPMHPYEMASTLRERHKDESIKLNYGSLYAVVESLKKHELIAERETERAGNRPERTVYRLTDAGRLELIDWLSELLSRPAKEYTHFEAGLSLLPVLPPEDAVALLEQRCQALEVRAAQSQSVRELLAKRSFPRLFSIESEYRWALEGSELEWTRRLVADIKAGSLEGLELWRGFHARRPD